MIGTLFKEDGVWCVLTSHGNALKVHGDAIPEGMKEYDSCEFSFHHERGKRGTIVSAKIDGVPGDTE